MTWTTDTPTEPGFYWVEEPYTKPVIIELGVRGRNLYVLFAGNDEDFSLGAFCSKTRWYGPLKPPEAQ